MLKVVNENILCSCYSMRREAAFLGFVTLHGPYTNWWSVEETVGIIPAMSMTSARQTDRQGKSLPVCNFPTKFFAYDLKVPVFHWSSWPSSVEKYA